MYGDKKEPMKRLSLIEKLLRSKPRNQRALARALDVHPSTVLHDITHAQNHGLLLYEDGRGNLHVSDDVR